MKQVMWVLVLAVAAGLGYWLWYGLRRYREKKEAEAARHASFMAQAVGTAAKAAAEKNGDNPLALAQQKLLLEAGARAAEAGEPALAIQLYARLVARYPEGSLAAQARAAVEAQKRKLAKPPAA